MAPSIPVFYRVFFLYIDPLVCLSGIYLSFFDNATFVANGLPPILASYTQTPAGKALTKYFLNSLGS
jgi:hypothetical protein